MKIILLLPSAFMFFLSFISILLPIITNNIKNGQILEYIALLIITIISAANCRKHPYYILLIIEYFIYVIVTGTSVYAYSGVNYDGLFTTAEGLNRIAQISEKANYAYWHPQVAVLSVFNDMHAVIMLSIIGSIYIFRVYFLKNKLSKKI